MKIKGKVWKTGNAHVITVPKAYIDSGMLKDGDDVVLDLEVCKDDLLP